MRTTPPTSVTQKNETINLQNFQTSLSSNVIDTGDPGKFARVVNVKTGVARGL